VKPEGRATSEQLSEKIYAEADRLKFSGQLEKGFQTDFSRRYNHYIRVVLAVATLMYLLSGLIDFFLLRDTVVEVYQVRFFIAAPLLILFCLYAFTANFWRFQQYVLLGFILVVSGSLLLMSNVTQGIPSHVYFTALVVTQLAGLTVLRLQFRFALMGAAGIMFLALLSNIFFSTTVEKIVIDVYFFSGVSVISMVAAYFFEQHARRDFIQKSVLERDQEKLQAVNTHLNFLVANDSLTGIANRRYFDETIQDEWRRAQRGQYPLSLLMIDIDNFKAYNDNYGHQRGDEVLRIVAKTLAGFGKRAGDMVARYGGEEFAIVSAGTSYQDAISFAQKVCKSVAHVGIPHEKSDISDVVTVSIGVATITPLLDQDVSTLIRDADKNLYQAKANGRNCVFGAKSTLGRLD